VITDQSGKPVDYRIVEANRALEIQTGVPLEQLIGNTALSLHPDLDPYWIDTYGQVALTGEPAHFDRFVPQQNRHYEVSACQLRTGRFAALFTDVTARKRNEERLRQTQKLESVGLLAGGIAHDFNNLLTGVMGSASLLLEDAAPGHAEVLRSIIASTERAAHLTRQLLAYSGKGQFIVREMDVSQAVNETADLVQFSIPKSASLALNLERRLPWVAMDPGQLQQILMNLVINAGEAIGDGNPGRITVTTSMADIQSPFNDELGEEIAPGRYVCIEVRDTGSGIDPAKKAKIFDPFFTTKFVGRGLGLAAIGGILRSQKGGITVESALGKGSTFRVFLPVTGTAGPGVQGPAAGSGRPSILVVDDEVAVRDFIGAALRRKGYHVVQASDGQEALAVCGSAPGAIGAAIVDVIMPNMSANDLLSALKAKQPGMRILLTSGYSEAEARRLCAAYPGAAFIQKPYTAQQLAKTVDELVGVLDS
ncbi:MAG TPA: ATP-binding protein, partial [Bryobacteraceae bacterium]